MIEMLTQNPALLLVYCFTIAAKKAKLLSDKYNL